LRRERRKASFIGGREKEKKREEEKLGWYEEKPFKSLEKQRLIVGERTKETGQSPAIFKLEKMA